MKISTFFRHVREGLKNIGRNGWMTFAAVGSVVVSLLILGVFLTVALNLQELTKDVEAQVQMDVFMQEGTSRSDIQMVEEKIKALPEVKSVEFVSKEDAIRLMVEKYKEHKDLFAGLEMDNPFPDKFIVKAHDPRQSLQLADQIRTFPNVEKVSDGREVVETLFKVMDIVRWIGGALIVGLALTAVFLISNTIKITIYSRRREIEIMKLVGATNWFIRWPFFFEGLLMGALGALIPITLIAAGYGYILNNVTSDTFIPLLPLGTLVTQVGGVLLLIGAVIGVFGSTFSVRKFLKI
ncbi:permease-like cell division protein FtsX [Effusibacillus lacus]|uniref:Cell division protein FtsX n=1 Tax=Effusibacillus lacus TaxID=1348429 RepID=A0A292YQP6_9BACL|nr:permease-like cell division protein FtsX [Effusibacillus lacus]TCS74178.1 cell division protein FtsX [Effusibacillus lacus]GAX90825.1 ABC transporter permease [Effusibacillus lacus]